VIEWHLPKSKGRFALAAAAFGGLGMMVVLLAIHFTGQADKQGFVENLVVVPIVVGKDETDAIAAIEAAGLRPEITYRRLDGRRGRVIAQSLSSSHIGSRGDSVWVVVAAAKTRPPPNYLPFAHWPS
jgi:PASTA domain